MSAPVTTSRPAAGAILLSALILGGLGDFLLYDSAGPGINLPLLTLALAGYTGWLTWRYGDRAERRRFAPALLTAVFFASWIAVRDAEALTFFNLVAIGMALALPLLRLRGVQAALARPVDCVLAAIASGWHAATGAIPALGEFPWRDRVTPGMQPIVARGAVLLFVGLPVMIIFGALFAGADPVFGSAAARLLSVNIDLGPIAGHTVVTLAIFWLSAGYLRAQLLPPRPTDVDMPALPRHPELAAIAGTALGATVLMFTLFVGLQARMLFGGADFVRETTGMTYSAYAVSGFYQLLVASGLALPITYVSTLLPSAGGSSRRALETVQVILLVPVLVSALWRMWMYVAAYGLTEDRVYSSAIMIWLAAVVALFAATVLRRRPRHFTMGAVVAGWMVLGGLNLWNPEARIVRHNAARGEDVVGDPYYTRLSADAVPARVAAALAAGPGWRCSAPNAFARIERRPAEDWRSSHLSRRRSREALAQLPALATVSCPAAPEAVPAAGGSTGTPPTPVR